MATEDDSPSATPKIQAKTADAIGPQAKTSSSLVRAEGGAEAASTDRPKSTSSSRAPTSARGDPRPASSSKAPQSPPTVPQEAKTPAEAPKPDAKQATTKSGGLTSMLSKFGLGGKSPEQKSSPPQQPTPSPPSAPVAAPAPEPEPEPEPEPKPEPAPAPEPPAKVPSDPPSAEKAAEPVRQPEPEPQREPEPEPEIEHAAAAGEESESASKEMGDAEALPVHDEPAAPEDPVEPAMPKIPIEEAVRRLQSRARLYNAVKRVAWKRAIVKARQRKVMLLINWAVVTIQRTARAMMGRNRFIAHKIAHQKSRAKLKNNCAITIQRRIRGILGRARIRRIKREIENERIRQEYANYGKKKKAAEAEQAALVAGGAARDSSGGGAVSKEELEKIRKVEEKLRKLEEMEKNLSMKQSQMDEATRMAEERAAAMERAVKELQEKAVQAEAEALARKQMEEQMNNQLLALAAGSLTERSDYTTPTTNRGGGGPAGGTASAMNTAQRKGGIAQQSARGGHAGHSAPPSARSARGGAAITPDTIKLRFKGQDWAKLWDPDEKAWYWYNEATQNAQWEMPGEEGQTQAYSGYESGGGALTDYSTDGAYESGGDITENENDPNSGAIIVTANGAQWSEFWDDGAQAKYWYNYATGEATWARPEPAAGSVANSARSAVGSARGSARGAGGGGGMPETARAGAGMGDWASYIDEATGQEFWYNTVTGETSWA